MIQSEKKYLKAEPIVAWSSFFILLATYWLTVAPTVSFWDCPEYVSAAWLLEIGHPPGNPLWMLVERIVTLFAPSAEYAALAVNLSSGLFTAFAAFFLAKTIFRVALWVLLKLPRKNIPAPLAAAGGALVGTLAFGWCDSVWYSAVEAEVYALSLFLTSLCVWLMTKWAGTSNRGDSWRLLVLIAYIFGLSIGAHQLNLLCIPPLALIWAVRRGIRSFWKLAFIFFLSLILVACILMGMMPSTIALAAEFELIAVNHLGLPALSGVAIYVATLGISLLAALFVISRSQNRVLMAITCFPSIFLSGIFILSNHYLAGLIISAIVAVLLVIGSNFKARRLYLSMWMLAMLLTGYSCYAIIPIRGSIPSPANSAMPGEPFAFASYLSREQYGSKPLLYGPTPFSKSILKEEFNAEGKATYNVYDVKYGRPYIVPLEKDARLRHNSPSISRDDSISNAALISRNSDAYIVRGRKPTFTKTPELNMWFPRITSNNPVDIKSYREWLGMDSTSMTKLEISEAIDSAGNFVAKMDADGKRGNPIGYRPTYLQNAQWLLSYQTAYMYWRYLMWNFCGRQNDRPAQGEVQHGNFITGFSAIDNAMLGADDALPPFAGKENPGRNRYFMLPLLLGFIGIGWLLKSRRRGMQTCAVTAVLFVMTGLAITIYLNQDPGEARERDYSFLGSFLAYCVWIGFGAIMIARRFKSVWGFILPLAIPLWMLIENYDDHDRSDRYAAKYYAINILNSLEKDAILFAIGDNYTFPLWYAQEVEGVRTDVRVINLSYLNTAPYTANLMIDWRDSKALTTTLKRPDIIWEAFRSVKIPLANRDTMPALEALEAMRSAKAPSFPTRYVTLKVAADSSAVFDLKNLAATGRSSTEFYKLMMFDILANASEGESPRPVYWFSVLNQERRLYTTQLCSKWIFGYRFGQLAANSVDSMIVNSANKFFAPNPIDKDVYMDHAPAIQVASMRGAIVSSAIHLLNRGKLDDALNLADKADILMGADPETFGNILVGDSAFSVRKNLGQLLINCADSLEVRAKSESISAEKDNLTAKAEYLKKRGQYHLSEYNLRKKAWSDYRKALPRRLRGKMSPTY